MSEAIDLTLLSTLVQGLDREMRLLRLQVDHLASRASALDGRLGALEKTFHDLVTEVSRGFGQNEQRFNRVERRLDAVDSGLTSLRTAMDESTAQIIAALRGSATPG